MKTRPCLLKISLLLATLGLAGPVSAAVAEYGDEDVLGTGGYPSDPKAGAALEGLAAGAVSYAAASFGHGFPFTPSPGDFAGTDQIYVGSVQTASVDGYSVADGRLNGPQTFRLDYHSLVPPGRRVETLTLGIAADDFQYPSNGQPFLASINGASHAGLAAVLNGLDQGGPQARFFTIGLDPALLGPDNVLTLAIDQGGNGGDGWAVDYLTVGVTTAPVPVPAAAWLFASALAGLGAARRGKPRRA